MTIDSLHQLFLSSTGICTDTRQINPGELFIALKGPNFNANKLAEEAITKGAVAAIIDDASFHKEDGKYILVENGLKTLQILANYHRKYLNTPLIGITGSNGKTTTKELMYQVLAKKYNVLATTGNLNNHIGVPLTLLRLTKDHELGIVEMGANHVGEIHELCEIAAINYGLITSIGKAHLEGFGSFDNIKKTKKALYDYCIDHDGKCFVNESLDLVKELFNGKPDQLISYGNRNRFEVSQVRQQEHGITIDYHFDQDLFQIKTQLFGTYNALNVSSALAVGFFFNLSMEDMVDAIAEYTPNNNRSQIKNHGGGKFIMDAYNANPTSMRLAIESIGADKNSRKLLILGDMAELGEQTIEEHENIISLINSLELPTILIGKNFNQTKDSKYCKKFNNVEEARSYVLQYDFSDTIVLVKGSRSIALEQLFDD